MATERQIAANRKNALRGKGPSSRAGIARAARNAYRHGLAASPGPDVLQQVEQLAREIAGNTAGILYREKAREAAHAAIDLVRVREIKIAIFNRALAAEEREASRPIDPLSKRQAKRPRMPPTCDPKSPAKIDHSVDRNATAQMTEALRRALPDLVKLDRYEARALARRNRAIRALTRGIANSKKRG